MQKVTGLGTGWRENIYTKYDSKSMIMIHITIYHDITWYNIITTTNLITHVTIAQKCNAIILITIIITDIILLTNWWAWLDYRAGEASPPLPAVVDVVLVVVVVLVVGLAHVMVVGSIGVPIVRRVEAVSEVVEMLGVGVHQSLQRPRVHWRHHLNMTRVRSGLYNDPHSNLRLPCAGLRVWSRCVSWGYCCDRKSSHTCHTWYFWSSGELCECVDLDWNISPCSGGTQPV